MKKIPHELEVEIVRLHFAEKWPVGTIAAQVGVHHSVVRRVLQQSGLPVPKIAPRPSMVDPYMPFIIKTLDKYPKLTASRLFQMVKGRGYPGQPSRFRQLVSQVRPRPKCEAYLRLSTLPGEQGQVDWGHFGKLLVGSALRPLLAFVMVLCWSRVIFLRFFLDARMPSFLRGHVEAFRSFGGVPRNNLYDNLKSAVTERVGDAIRFNSTMLDLASHYRFGPRAAAPGRGNEKGRVERSIRYIRSSFFAGREVTDLDKLNEEARIWCAEVANLRRWPDDHSKTVQEAFEEERKYLLPLPDDDFPCEEIVNVSVGKTPYVRFDKNDYSVPHTHVRKNLDLIADEQSIRISEGTQVLATHSRCYDKGKRIERPEHIAELVEYKRNSKTQTGMGRLLHAAPQSEAFMRRAAERGLNLGSTTAQLLTLLDEYGASAVNNALQEVNEREVVHVPAVRQLLRQWRHAQGRREPIPVSLPNDPRLRDLVVRPHELHTYDNLLDSDDDKEENHE